MPFLRTCLLGKRCGSTSVTCSPQGILAFHISNKVLDLEPVIAAAAADAGLSGCTVSVGDDLRLYRLASTWVLLSRDPAQVQGLGRPVRRDPNVRLWTDDYSNIWTIIRR